MNYLIHHLLNAEELNLIKKELENCSQQDWEDGKKTAGSHASMVKNNLQLNRDTEVSKKNAQLVTKKILSSQLIKSFSLPKRIHGIMFTKSSKNMHYGRHIDNPYMSSGRSDLSFTLSLTNKDFYKGGELIIETMNSEEKFKLNAGEIIIYPSSYLHAVNEVNNGERLVCVGWIESYVKSPEKRELFFLIFALFEISIYGYFIPIKTVQPSKANFYTSSCIIFYISYELSNPSIIKR